MVTPYVDPATIHVPATGNIPPAAWGTQLRNNGEFHIDPPACAALHSTTQNVTSGASFTTLSADSEDFDNDAMHSTVTNPSRITIATAGRFLFATTVIIQSNASGGFRGLRMQKNGTTVIDMIHVPPAGGSSGTILSGTRVVTMAATDFMEVQCRQDSGSTLTALLLEFSAYFLTR